jgi:hypothetical protein
MEEHHEEEWQFQLFGRPVTVPSLFSSQLLWLVENIETVSAGSTGLEIVCRRQFCGCVGYKPFLKWVKALQVIQRYLAPIFVLIALIATVSDKAIYAWFVIMNIEFWVVFIMDLVVIYALFIPAAVIFGRIPFVHFEEVSSLPGNLINNFVEITRISRGISGNTFQADINIGDQSVPVDGFVAGYYQVKGSAKIMLYSSKYSYKVLLNTVPFIAWDFYPIVFTALLYSNGRSPGQVVGWIFLTIFLCLLLYIGLMMVCLMIGWLSKLFMACFPSKEDFFNVVMEYEGTSMATTSANPLTATVTTYSPPVANTTGGNSNTRSDIPVATPVNYNA